MIRTVLILGFASLSIAACAQGGSRGTGGVSGEGWQEDFKLAERTLSDTGESPYFVLRPGFELVLAGGNTKLTITVLDETKRVDGVTTRVVEEREAENGQLIEVSRNFFAIDNKTGDVFYFGEDVDDYARGQIVGHAGSWLAAAGGPRPGLIMPGTPRVGMKYFQEIAPGVALDRAEILSTTERCSTPAGPVANCLLTRETTPLEPGVTEQKTYAPGIGLIRDKELRLTSHGYRNKAAP